MHFLLEVGMDRIFGHGTRPDKNRILNLISGRYISRPENRAAIRPDTGYYLDKYSDIKRPDFQQDRISVSSLHYWGILRP